MEKEDLIKKLEEAALPDIEIPGYKIKLRASLINQYYQEKRNWVILDIVRKVTSLGLAVFLIVSIFNRLIYPTYSLVKAKEIALQDPQVKELMEGGAIIKDIEIVNKKAYILVQSSEEEKESALNFGAAIKKTEEKIAGVLAEVDFTSKKVSKIEELTPAIIPLTETEKEKAKEIAKNNPNIREVLPQEAEVLRIDSILPQMKLIKQGKSVQVIPEPGAGKKVFIIYQLGKNQWKGKIDLTTERAEEINFLGEVEE